MAVVTTKSGAMTAYTASPKRAVSANLVNGNLRESQGLCAVANGDGIGSVLQMFPIRSSDRVSSLKIYCSAITSAAADVGLYRTADDGGAVVDADFFASAVSLASALSGSDVTFEAGAAGGALANAEKRVWEALGLTSDPNLTYVVALTLTAAAGAAGSVVLRGQFVSGE